MTAAKKFIDESELLKTLHGPFFPSDIRVGENIKANLERAHTGKSYELRVWKISPLGIELVDNSMLNIGQGEKVNISILVGGQITEFSGLVVDAIDSEVNQRIIGIRLTTIQQKSSSDIEKRENQRWVTTEQFLPTGMAPNPAKYNDFLFFRVKDISAGGMQVITSLRNKFILTGMTFDANISFPMVGQVRIPFRVKNIRIIQDGNSEYLSLGVQYLEKNTEMFNTLGQYIAQFSNVTDMNDLHREGLSPSSLKNSVQFSFVKTEEEYREVLNLRYLSNKKEGKISDGTTVEDMGDIYDTRSRIVIGRMAGKIVVSARMTFNEYDQKLEHEEYVIWNSNLPRREESIEVMRACTHPDFQGNDLFFLMWKFMCISIVQSGRKWIVMSTTAKYYPMYKRMGGITTDVKFQIPSFANSQHQLILGDVQGGMLGRNIHPIVWNYLYGDLLNYLDSNGNDIEIKPIDRIRICLYRILAPITHFITHFYIAPKRIERARLKAPKYET